MHHGTLLFSTEMNDMSEALKVNPLKFEDKAVKSVRKRVTNISSHLAEPMTVMQFTQQLMEYVMQNKSNAQQSPLTQAEIAQIEQLRDEKYSTWDWNFGTSPRYSYSKLIRTTGGNLEIHLQIEKGTIEAVRIYGDFFALKDVKELEQKLLHLPHERKFLYEFLQDLQVETYLLNISAEEFLEVMF